MKKPSIPSRREFIAASAVGAAGAILPSRSAAAVQSGPPEPESKAIPASASSDDLRVAVVGLRGRGWNHTMGFARLPGVRVVALCDVDSEVLKRRAAECAAGGKNRPAFEVETTGDIRTLLDRDDIDVISIATPNHTHSMLACWALDAGKHVYCEKPVSHVVEEGQRIVDAAKRSGRICASGTQGRSASSVRSAIDFVHSGGLGKVHCSRGLCYKPRRSIGASTGPKFVPSSVDYDRWLGPVAYLPLDRRQLHYDWHWNLATGNGDLGNQGIHQMDIARWALDQGEMPKAVSSVGGRFGYEDAGDSPNTQVAIFDCGEAPLVFEVRGLPKDKASQSAKWEMDRYEGQSIGNIVHGENGMVRISNSYSWADFIDADGKKQREWKGGGDHFANFVEAVRADDQEILAAPIVEGHLSSAFCHLGILSHQLGDAATPSEIDAAWAGDPIATDAWSRMSSHLRANAVDLSATPVVLGRPLRVQASGDAIIGDPEATAMLFRNCREPYSF
ncbi:MAG: Gfo/Idh/MocA family oxidoreductase [Phycisphaerales bacterium]|nr:Gfo/Idh/MocA family oxidoreductase [Phycisphaerales bacterium]